MRYLKGEGATRKPRCPGEAPTGEAAPALYAEVGDSRPLWRAEPGCPPPPPPPPPPPELSVRARNQPPPSARSSRRMRALESAQDSTRGRKNTSGVRWLARLRRGDRQGGGMGASHQCKRGWADCCMQPDAGSKGSSSKGSSSEEAAAQPSSDLSASETRATQAAAASSPPSATRLGRLRLCTGQPGGRARKGVGRQGQTQSERGMQAGGQTQPQLRRQASRQAESQQRTHFLFMHSPSPPTPAHRQTA